MFDWNSFSSFPERAPSTSAFYFFLSSFCLAVKAVNFCVLSLKSLVPSTKYLFRSIITRRLITLTYLIGKKGSPRTPATSTSLSALALPPVVAMKER